MNTAQVIAKTIATTVDFIIALIVILDKRNPDSSKKVITVLMLINLMGVWI